MCGLRLTVDFFVLGPFGWYIWPTGAILPSPYAVCTQSMGPWAHLGASKAVSGGSCLLGRWCYGGGLGTSTPPLKRNIGLLGIFAWALGPSKGVPGTLGPRLVTLGGFAELLGRLYDTCHS